MDFEKSVAPTLVLALAWVALAVGLVLAAVAGRDSPLGVAPFVAIGMGSFATLLIVRWFMLVLAAIQGSLQRLDDRAAEAEPRPGRSAKPTASGGSSGSAADPTAGRRYVVGNDGQVRTEDAR